MRSLQHGDLTSGKAGQREMGSPGRPGGRTTKIHALVNVLGRPLRLILTPGTTRMKRVPADRGYDADRLHAAPQANNTIPIIHGRRNRPIQHDTRRYKDRWRVKDYVERPACMRNRIRRDPSA